MAAKHIRPAYLELLESGELEHRAIQALTALEDCAACPRQCHVDRLAGERHFCLTGRWARIASYAPHFGEEEPYAARGDRAPSSSPGAISAASSVKTPRSPRTAAAGR